MRRILNVRQDGTGYLRNGTAAGEMPVTKETGVIRCHHDGLKMAEVQNGHLILRRKHHGETHVVVVPLKALVRPESRD